VRGSSQQARLLLDLLDSRENFLPELVVGENLLIDEAPKTFDRADGDIFKACVFNFFS
jgi:hypothetical protein